MCCKLNCSVQCSQARWTGQPTHGGAVGVTAWVAEAYDGQLRCRLRSNWASHELKTRPRARVAYGCSAASLQGVGSKCQAKQMIVCTSQRSAGIDGSASPGNRLSGQYGTCIVLRLLAASTAIFLVQAAGRHRDVISRLGGCVLRRYKAIWLSRLDAAVPLAAVPKDSLCWCRGRCGLHKRPGRGRRV